MSRASRGVPRPGDGVLSVERRSALRTLAFRSRAGVRESGVLKQSWERSLRCGLHCCCSKSIR